MTKTVSVQEIYNNGRVAVRISMVNGMWNGPATYYNEDGSVNRVLMYSDGILNGKCCYFIGNNIFEYHMNNGNGVMIMNVSEFGKMICSYVNGKPIGITGWHDGEKSILRMSYVCGISMGKARYVQSLKEWQINTVDMSRFVNQYFNREEMNENGLLIGKMIRQ